MSFDACPFLFVMKTANSRTFTQLYDLLLESYGPQGWWPLLGRAGLPGYDDEGYHPGMEPELSPADRYEIAVGAVLTQNTSWNNVRTALHNLHGHFRNNGTGLNPDAVCKSGNEVLAELIKSSGYFNQKAKKIMIMSPLFAGFNGIPGREELLNLWGIGPETADSILLYAFDRAVFVIDAYTRRIISRISGSEVDASDHGYHRLQNTFQENIPADTRLYREYHALLVAHAKARCLKREPLCGDCPVRGMCNFVVQIL